MAKERKITRDGPLLVRAALHLDEAMNRFETEMSRVNRHMRRAVELSRQVDTLARALNRQWTQDGHSRLLAAQARFDTEQKALDRAKRDLTGARNGSAAAYDAYLDAFDRQGAALAEMRSLMQQRHRQNAAMERALDFLTDRACEAESRRLREEGREAGFTLPEESHAYIVIGVQQFFEMLHHLDTSLADDPDFADADDPGARYRPVSFLEVGSGPGRNLLLARGAELVRFGRMAGFDIDSDAIALGRRALGLEDELMVADALDFDYGGWDVIYSYRPIRDRDLQMQLERRIAETMDPGAYLLAPLPRDIDRYPQMEPTGFNPHIWRKTRPAPA